MGFFVVIVLLVVCAVFAIRFCRSRQYKPSIITIPNLPIHISLLKIKPEDYLNYENPIERFMSFLDDVQLSAAKTLSNDEIVYKHDLCCGKPDFVFSLENDIHAVEYKIRKMQSIYSSCLIYTDMLQVSICSYLMSKEYKDKKIISYLRYDDCLIKFDPSAFYDYIEFASKIYPRENINTKLLPSKKLAEFICLIVDQIPYSPENNEQSSLKGMGMHNLMAYEGKIPDLVSSEFPHRFIN